MVTRVRRGRRPTPGAAAGVSAQAAALVRQAYEAIETSDNKTFTEMYAFALERRVYHADSVLFDFLKRLNHPPVGIEEFLDGKEFLGSTDLTLWPEVRKAIIDINKYWWKGPTEAYHEALLMGSTSCVDGETEFLTPTGWKRIDEYIEGDLVAQYRTDGTAVFVTPDKYIDAPARGFYSVVNKATQQRLTSGHRVIWRSRKTGRVQESTIDHIASLHNESTYGWKPGELIGAFNLRRSGELPLTDAQIRLMVAVMADGCFASRRSSHTRYCTIRVKKERKKERIVRLLREAGLRYNYYEGSDGYAAVSFRAPRREKRYTGFWWGASPRQLGIIYREAVKWDGDNKEVFRTTINESAEFIQYAATACGVRTSISPILREDKGHKEYRVQYLNSVTFGLGSSSPSPITYEPSEESCYCFTVPSSMWVARRRGKVFVTGNSGKSEIAKITTLFHLYLLSCIDNPQALYGLPSTTSIVFAILAAKPHVTKKVLYAPMRLLVETMPYFQKHLRPDRLVESEMNFEEQNIRVVPGGSDADSILGEAIIGGIIDEINFMNIVLKSKRAEISTGRAGVFDQAQTIHGAMTRRKKGRFTYGGPLIGLVCTSSSTRYKGDFTDKRKQQVVKHKERGVYIYDKPQYEVWPEDRYCGEKFRLLVGNDIISDTRILSETDVVPEGSWVLDIPIEYLADFQKDPHSALRDVCGISTSSISPFFKRRFKIYEAIALGEEAGLESFLMNDNVILGVDDMPRVKFGHYCANPSRPRYVHIDLSTTGDRCGIAMVRFDGMTDVTRSGGIVEKLPIATVELACSIAPDANSELQFAEVRMWVKQLRDMYGYPIKAVTYDGQFSIESIQQWRKVGMKTGHLSVDKAPSIPYKQLRDTFNDGRLRMFSQDVLVGELFDLEYDEVKDKVDHPPNSCFTGDTRVALLDGTNPTFEELGERYGDGRPFAVYSMSDAGVTVGWARNPRMTRESAQLVEVTLDNYQVIRCTPDHLFMTVGHEWVKAKNLTPSVSIMPLYRSREEKGGWSGYERYWCPVQRKRILTHHMVAEEYYGAISDDDHVHHKNENKGDNRPGNLVLMGKKGHLSYHTAKRHRTDKEYVRSLREGHRQYRESGGNERSRQNILRLFEQGKLKRGRDICCIEGCIELSNAKGMCGIHYQRMRRVQKKAERASRQNNHRVMSVRALPYTMDVWDITVEEYHNFALASGVFVHNSKDVADAVCGAYYSMLMRRASWSSAQMDDEAQAKSNRMEEVERYEPGGRAA